MCPLSTLLPRRRQTTPCYPFFLSARPSQRALPCPCLSFFVFPATNPKRHGRVRRPRQGSSRSRKESPFPTSFVPARLVLSRGTRTKQDRDHSLLRARPTQLLESAGLPPSTTKAKQSRFKVQRRHLHTFVAGVALYFGLTGGPQAHTPARGKVAATSPRLVSDASLASLTSTSFALNSVFWSNLHPSCPAFRCLRTQTRHPACAPCRARHNKHFPAKPLQRRNPTKVPPVSGACRHRV